MPWTMAPASPRATGQRHGLVEVEVDAHVELVAVLVAEEAADFLRLQIDLAHQDGVALPPAEERAQIAQPVMGRQVDPAGDRSVSSRKGTASTRKPDRPSSSQKPMILRISSRTAGLAMLRSGCCL